VPPPLLLLHDISLTFGMTPLLSGATLAIAAGDRICLVGRNGSGKSTLLHIAAGLLQADTGERFAQPGAPIQYLPQQPHLAGFGTTLAYVEEGFDSARADGRHRALYLLKELGLSGDEDPESLSGGEARRAALARALAPSPDILLLDEPTNHLDLPGIEWLERELAGMRAGIVLISHDRRLLERFSRSTVWLDRGATRLLDEGFSAFEAWRDAVLAREADEQHKLGRKIAMEEDWLRHGVTARRTRNQRRLAELQALRRRRREHRGATGMARLEAARADLSGRLVVAAESISKSSRAGRNYTSASGGERYHLARNGRRSAEPRPRVHQLSALLEQVAAPVCRLDLVADGVREGHLGHFVWEARALSRPIPEARPETVDCQIAPAHTAQCHCHRHIADRLAGPTAGEDGIVLAHRLHLLEDGARCI